MISRSRYEKFLLRDFQGLSDNDFWKVVKTVHFFREEIFKEKQGNVDDVLRFAGIWKDETYICITGLTVYELYKGISFIGEKQR